MIELKMDDVPPFKHTSIDDIPSIHARVTDKFHTHATRPIAYRQQQLRSLYWGLKDAEPALLEACKFDLGKSNYEAYLTEVGWVLNDIIFMSKNLERFAKDESPADIDLTNRFMRPKIRKDPLGSVLIIGVLFQTLAELGTLLTLPSGLQLSYTAESRATDRRDRSRVYRCIEAQRELAQRSEDHAACDIRQLRSGRLPGGAGCCA